MQGPQLPAPPQLRHCVYLRQTHATCAMRFIAHAHEAKQGNSAQLKTFESCASMRQCTHLTRHGALSNATLTTQHQHHLLHPLQTRPANLGHFLSLAKLVKIVSGHGPRDQKKLHGPFRVCSDIRSIVACGLRCADCVRAAGALGRVHRA